MKKSYRKGVANHPDPEPCEGSRKAALEALDRGICRLGIELRNRQSRELTWSDFTESNKAVCVKGECTVALRSRFVESASKTPRMHRNFTRENREAPLLSVVSRTRTAGRKR